MSGASDTNSLRARRLELGLTQATVATAVGIGRQRLNEIERGRSKQPRWELVARLALVLGADPYELFPIFSPLTHETPATTARVSQETSSNTHPGVEARTESHGTD